MKFYLYYTMITGHGVMEAYSASEALAAHETLRLAGATVTRILDETGVAYTLADLAKLASNTLH